MATNKNQPALFGIKQSNRDFTKSDAWGKNQFNSSFPASLVAYMFSKEIPCVYIKTNKNNEIVHKTISAEELFGISPLSKDIFYAFETVYTPYQQFYKGTIPRVDLVIQNKKTGECLKGLEIKLTALPDNSTCELPENQFSSEIVIRPDTISYLASSIVKCYINNNSALKLIFDTFSSIKKWDNEREIIKQYPLFISAINQLISLHSFKQKPIVLQPIWKTQGKSSLLATNCLDAFVWSNLALIHLFTDFCNQNPTRIGRTERTLVWLVKMIHEFTQNGSFNASYIIDKLSFNTKNDKAFAVNGHVTFPLLQCKELSNPRITKGEIKNIILGGGQNLLSPERRFDAIIYNSPDLFK